MPELSRRQYAERRKTELYDELDDEDEDEIILAAHSATISRFQDDFSSQRAAITPVVLQHADVL